MRSICALVMVAAVSSSAGADVSKAWQAAKDNLPDTIPAIGAVDVAAVVKQPAFGKLLALVKKEDRGVREGIELVKSACNLDLTQVVDGVVVAGDPDGKDDDIMVFLQLKIDRPKASTCLEAMLRTVEKRKQVTVQQTGKFTEASVGDETAYFAWVDKAVVAFNVEPIKKARLERFVGKQGLAKSPVGSLFGKLDPKAAAFGAIKLAKPLDRDLPFTQVYGNATLTGTTLAGAIVGTATDTAAAGKFVTEAKRELIKLALRDKLPAIAKKLVTAVTLNAVGAEVTLKGSAATGDLVEAITELAVRKPAMPADPPPAEAP
jgi:hypothetical protein